MFILGIGLMPLAVSIYLIYMDIDDLKYRMGNIENDISRMRKCAYNVTDKLPNSYHTGEGGNDDADKFYRIYDFATLLIAIYGFCTSIIKIQRSVIGRLYMRANIFNVSFL